jgi:hypothetical protein
MVATPSGTLPKQCGTWADLKAAYRLLSNSDEAVTPDAIQAPHRSQTRAACVGQRVILSVQDDSEMAFNLRSDLRGAGKLANGQGQGFIQHSALAVRPDGFVLGLLDHFFFNRVDAPEVETRLEREARWCESDVWADTVRRIGGGLGETRLIHVMDRAGDDIGTMEACDELGVGFVIRAKHDRRVDGGTDKLWTRMSAIPAAAHMEIQVRPQRDARNRVVQTKRRAKVSIRFAQVCLEPPWNHPGSHRPRMTWVVYVCEDRPPANTEAVEWMLLTSEPVENLAAAQQVIRWYRLRWVIEEWHRVEKEGCRVQASQLDDVQDIQRLTAIVGVIAVRLLQLRDLAGSREKDADESPEPLAEGGPDDPKTLSTMVPAVWITVVAALAKTSREQLTPRQFWLTIARRGGWLGRRSDGRPGWKVIWRGWYDISLMVEGAELHAAATSPPPRCG